LQAPPFTIHYFAIHNAYLCREAMDKELPQITFDFSPEDEGPKEFLSGQPVHPPQKPKSTRGRKKLKETEPEEPIEIPDDEVLFQKAYYGIGEVAEMFKVNISLIRHWENEFDILEPRKNRKGDRFFRPIDIKNLVLIHDLVRRRKFTLEGAKEFLKKNQKAREKHELIQSLQKIKNFLLELKANL
jgi:DNA-binding transcriptional MerR regulator